MEVIHQIQKMLKDGKESEARELYFAELAPLLNDFRGALDDLLNHGTKQIDHDMLWRQIRLSFEEIKSPRSKLRGIKRKCILMRNPRFLKLFPLSGNPIASYGESVRLNKQAEDAAKRSRTL